jgi:quinol monooxygenase YgiN
VVFVTFRARAITAEVVPELCRLAQSTERQQTVGWLGDGCLVRADDHREVLGYESWATRASWEAWLHSEACDRLNRALAPLHATALRIEVWEEP